MTKKGHLYISVYGNVPESISFSINDDEATEVKGLDKHNRIVDMGYVDEGDLISISSENDFKLKCYIMDPELLKEGFNNLSESGLKVDVFSDTYISGDYEAKTDGTYMFTIPYDKGWSVFVDGQQVDTGSALGAFLSFKTDKGHHDVELRYFPRGLKAGIIITLASLGILVILIITGRRQKDWEVIS